MHGGCAAVPEEIPSAQFSPVNYGNFIPVMTTLIAPDFSYQIRAHNAQH
jgi:hypothetical protein